MLAFLTNVAGSNTKPLSLIGRENPANMCPTEDMKVRLLCLIPGPKLIMHSGTLQLVKSNVSMFITKALLTFNSQQSINPSGKPHDTRV